MAEGHMGEENYNEMEESMKKAENVASPIADKAIDKAAEKIAGKFGEPTNNVNTPEPKENKSKDLLKQAHEDNKNSIKELGAGIKSGVQGDKEGAVNHLKNSAKNKASSIGNTAKAATSGAGKNIAAGMGDKVGDAIKNTGRVDGSEASGDVVNNVTDAAVDTAKTAVKAGVAAAKIAASGGTDVKAWVDLLKSGILKWVLFFALLPLIAIFVLIFCMGGMIAEAFAKLSEAFTAITEKINPTEYESFSMEDQYEVLSEAFGDEVYRAYEKMLEDVDDEIASYANSETYNEWSKVLKYNKSKGQIDYSSVYTSSDACTDSVEQGMPDSTVYIGGYTGDVEDDQWGVNNNHSVADTYSQTNPNYNKGLLKDGKTLDDDDCYITGNESYFDANEVKESIKASAGYAAVSDMAYMVAGYQVGMMEAPIIKFGTEVSALKADLTVIKYKIDISARLFSNEASNLGFFETTYTWMKDGLAKIFDGDTSFFTYDASKIKVVENTASRTVYEYSEKIYTVQEKKFEYTISYKYKYCPYGGTHKDDKGKITKKNCKGCKPKNATATYTAIPSHSNYINGYTYDSEYAPNSDDYKDEALASADYKDGAYDKKITKVETSDYGTTYQLNRSQYLPVTKEYTKYSLDIPMSAFDVDRMLKAIFETSSYYGELTYYYTDKDPSKKISTEDQIINKYGKYIDKWKYSYAGKEEYTYTGASGTFTKSYSEGEIFDNGIDQQPYFQQEEVYLYSCGCDPGFGVSAKCPNCGEVALQRSSDIEGGEGERPLTYIGTILVQQNSYFDLYGDTAKASSMDTWKTARQTIRQNSLIAMTTTDKKVIDDYTGNQVGGTTGALSSTSPISTASSTEGLAGVTPTSTLTGNSNTEKAWNFLLSKGLTPVQVAGLMGNIQRESHFNPSSFNPQGGGIGAYGICQWRAERQTNLKSYCSSNGLSYASLEGQLNYLWYELNTSHKGSLTALLSATTIEQATYAIGSEFERFEGSKNPSHTEYIGERYPAAKSFFATNGVDGGSASYNGDGAEGITDATIGMSASASSNVVLTDDNGQEYYPITVLERVLEVKNAALNVLENCDEIQQYWASIGGSYDQRYVNGTEAITTAPMAEYVANLVKNNESYTSIIELSTQEIAIGLGNWRGSEALQLINTIINNNPDAYKQICKDAGIDSLPLNWNKTSAENYSKNKQVIEKLLDLGHSEQDELFSKKLDKIVKYYINNHITEPATLALLSATSTLFKDINNLDKAGGTLGTFKEYVVTGSINAGTDNSFNTAYSYLLAWLGSEGNEYSSDQIKTLVSNFYNQISVDNSNGNLPWIGSGELTPENVQPIIDLATRMTESPYKDRFEYNQDNRYSISLFAQNLQSLYNTGEGYIIGDCSSFVAALYYCFGYNVPTSSGSWAGNSYGYVQRTDMENIQPGDVIVGRNSSGGHVEIYIGNGQSIGFGSAPPKIHSNWSSAFTRYPTVSYYRIVQ